MNTPPAIAPAAAAPICPTCQRGYLALKKKYRMSSPVVVIGWLLLIPSFLGILFGLLGLFASGGAATVASATIEKETRAQLEAAKIPSPIIESVMAGRPVLEGDKSQLTDAQKTAVSSAALSLAAGKVGAGAGAAIAGGLSIGIIVMSFIGGLLGWLLVMKKKVLQCPACSMVVAAS